MGFLWRNRGYVIISPLRPCSRQVGTGTGFTAAVSGRLYLSINDSYFGDNRGAWMAHISITQADNDLIIKTSAGITVDATGPSGTIVTYPLPVVTDPDAAVLTPDRCSPTPPPQ